MRNIFVAIIVLVGIRYTFQAPLYALLFYIWNAYFRPEQWLWSDWISSLNLSFTVGIYLLIAVLFAPAVRLRFSQRNVVFLLFALHCIVSMLLSDYTESAWAFMQEFLKVLIISYLITTVVDDLWKFRLTLLVVALSLGLEQAKQGWGNVIFNPGSTNNNPIPFLGDNNGVAIGMLMLVPLFMALLQTAGKHWERHVHRMSAIGVAIRAIVTYSRGGFLSAGALGVYYLVLSPKRVRSAIGIAVICLIVVPMMPDTFWDRMNTINASDEERDESALSRLHTWRVGLEMGKANPVFGVGFHSYEFAFDRYDFLEGQYGFGRASHSTWFGTLGDLGFVGLGLFVIMLLQTLYVSQRLRRTPKDQPRAAEIRIYATALQASMVPVVVGGTFLHLQYSEMLWHFFALTIALDSIAIRAAVQATPTSVPQAAALTSRPFPGVLHPAARPAAHGASAVSANFNPRLIQEPLAKKGLP